MAAADRHSSPRMNGDPRRYGAPRRTPSRGRSDRLSAAGVQPQDAEDGLSHRRSRPAPRSPGPRPGHLASSSRSSSSGRPALEIHASEAGGEVTGAISSDANAGRGPEGLSEPSPRRGLAARSPPRASGGRRRRGPTSDARVDVQRPGGDLSMARRAGTRHGGTHQACPRRRARGRPLRPGAHDIAATRLRRHSR